MSSRIDAFLNLVRDGRDSAVLRFGLGQALYDAARYAEAVEHLNEALGQDPGYSAAWKLLGKAYIASDDWQAAQGAYEEGLEAARRKGDQQSAKEMTVFLKRIAKRGDG